MRVRHQETDDRKERVSTPEVYRQHRIGEQTFYIGGRRGTAVDAHVDRPNLFGMHVAHEPVQLDQSWLIGRTIPTRTVRLGRPHQ
jgi:hypothetical protein